MFYIFLNYYISYYHLDKFSILYIFIFLKIVIYVIIVSSEVNSMQEPLAIKLRPSKLDEVIGQRHLIGEDKILSNLIGNK